MPIVASIHEQGYPFLIMKEKKTQAITQQIVDKILSGLSIQDIMAEHRLTKRQIVKLLKRISNPYAADKRQ